MDKTQKIMLGVALVTLAIAAVVYLMSGKNKGGEQQRPQQQQPRPQPQPQPQPVPQQQPLPPRQVSEKVMVLFFAPWCGHCKNIEPAWAEFAQNFDGYNGVKVLKINGQENPQLCQLHGVGGFPSIKFCPNGLNSPDGVVYNGDRSVNSLAQFLQQNA